MVDGTSRHNQVHMGEDVPPIEYYTERVKQMVSRVLTGNSITRYGDGLDALLQLCRQRLDALHRHSPRR